MHGQEHTAKMLAEAIKGDSTVEDVMSSKTLSKEQKRAVLRELRKTARSNITNRPTHLYSRTIMHPAWSAGVTGAVGAAYGGAAGGPAGAAAGG